MAEVTNKKNGLADKKAAYDKKKSELDSQKTAFIKAKEY